MMMTEAYPSRKVIRTLEQQAWSLGETEQLTNRYVIASSPLHIKKLKNGEVKKLVQGVTQLVNMKGSI